MKAKTLAVLSTAVFLSMSVIAHSEECNKESGFWFHWANGDVCLPYGPDRATGGTVNLYNGAGYVGTAACAFWHRPTRYCGWVKHLLLHQ
jgi:hypothetical protein